MKNLIVSTIFILFTAIVSAQQSSNNTENSKQQTTTTVENTDKKDNRIESAVKENALDADNICYSETSKVAFYEVLINQNGFDINLKESRDLAIKNTEEIIAKNKNQILYSEED